MPQVSLQLNEKGKGQFILTEGADVLGKMEVGLFGKDLVIYHTEVVPREEGHGLGKQLMTYLVDYARKNDLHVVPLCSYVLRQFNKTPTDYEDIWRRDK